MSSERARYLRLSYLYACLVAAGLGYFLLRIPIQVTDSLTNMAALDRPFGQLMRDTLADRSYLRPGLWAELKLVYDLADGSYFYWFRLTHVLQVLLVTVLFVRLVGPRSPAGALVLPLGLAALVGSHTFAWTLREAFPINTFLTIVVCCAAAACLSFGRQRAWRDVAAVGLFIVAALTVESGLLVGVIVVGGYVIGLRGVSRPAVAAVALFGAGYFLLRFLVLDVGAPTLAEREAGFGFQRYDGRQLQAMFGANPLGFYAYNVVSSITGVLLAEPRDGVWRLTRGFVHGRPEVPLVIGVTASAAATALIGRYVWRRRAAWLVGRLDRDDQLVALFGIVLVANAALTYGYTKDVIMSPAGFFFAAALCVASRQYLEELVLAPARRALPIAALAILSCAWAVRAVGIHAALAATAVQVREEWAYVDEFFADWSYEEVPPRVAALRDHLQEDALLRHPPKPPLREKWMRLFEVD